MGILLKEEIKMVTKTSIELPKLFKIRVKTDGLFSNPQQLSCGTVHKLQKQMTGRLPCILRLSMILIGEADLKCSIGL